MKVKLLAITSIPRGHSTYAVSFLSGEGELSECAGLEGYTKTESACALRKEIQEHWSASPKPITGCACGLIGAGKGIVEAILKVHTKVMKQLLLLDQVSLPESQYQAFRKLVLNEFIQASKKVRGIGGNGERAGQAGQ